MDERPCLTCTYARRPTGRLLRLALYRFPGLLICFHCAESDGQMTGVSPGGTCRNYRLRRKTPPATEPVDKAAGRKMLAPTPQEQEWRITLSDGLTTLVDREDFETLARHKWSPSRIGRKIYVMRLHGRMPGRPPAGGSNLRRLIGGGQIRQCVGYWISR